MRLPVYSSAERLEPSAIQAFQASAAVDRMKVCREGTDHAKRTALDVRGRNIYDCYADTSFKQAPAQLPGTGFGFIADITEGNTGLI